MKSLPAFLLLVLFYCSCSSQNKGGSVATGSDSTQPLNERYFYKRLEGTIAGQPVVMHLHRTANSYNGIYYYKNVGKWLTLSMDSVSADSIYLSEYSAGDGWSTEEIVNATLRWEFSGNKLNGTWVSGDRKKAFPVTLAETYPEGTLRFEMKSYADSMIAFPGKKDGPVARMDCFFIVSKDDEWINRQIRGILDFDSSNSFDEGFRRAADNYFAEYKHNLPAPDDTTIPLAVYNYANSQSVYVRFNDNEIVVLESDFYDYAGGAHGNYGSTFYCYDIINKKQLHLSDILNADSATLQPIVEHYFRIQYHVKATSLKGILFEEHLALTDNFYLTEKGIGFLYNPYEVASYAQGQVNVFVPFTAVKEHLTAYAIKRLKL